MKEMITKIKIVGSFDQKLNVTSKNILFFPAV